MVPVGHLRQPQMDVYQVDAVFSPPSFSFLHGVANAVIRYNLVWHTKLTVADNASEDGPLLSSHRHFLNRDGGPLISPRNGEAVR